jgi:hypothetical protein
MAIFAIALPGLLVLRGDKRRIRTRSCVLILSAIVLVSCGGGGGSGLGGGGDGGGGGGGGGPQGFTVTIQGAAGTSYVKTAGELQITVN